MTAVLATSIAVGCAVGWFGPRAFPKYKRGTRITVQWAHPFNCEYLYRSSIGFHKVRVLPGDTLGWGGRVITVSTRDMARR